MAKKTTMPKTLYVRDGDEAGGFWYATTTEIHLHAQPGQTVDVGVYELVRVDTIGCEIHHHIGPRPMGQE